jgi:hypothetical protein
MAVLDAIGELKIDTATAAKLVDAVREARSDQAAVEAVHAVFAAVRPLAQAKAATRGAREKQGGALRKTMAECARHVRFDISLTERLRQVDVPLVEPAASEYRVVLAALTQSTSALLDAAQELMGRLPAAA